MEQQDPALLERFNGGDRDAFQQIYHLYFGTVYFQLLRLLGKEEVAEELTASVFVKLWKLRGNFTDFANLKSFLMVSSYNEALDHLRQSHAADAASASDDQPAMTFHEEVLQEVILRMLKEEQR